MELRAVAVPKPTGRVQDVNAPRPGGSQAGGCAPEGLLFDVDGTLYHAMPLRVIMLMHLGFAFLLRPCRTWREARLLVYYRRAQEWLRQNGQSGEVAPGAQVARAAAMSGRPEEEVRACARYWMEEAPLPWLTWCARRRVVRNLKELHALGIPMGVYSDYPAGEKLKALGVHSLFSVVVCSIDADVRAYKPDPTGFRVAAARLGLSSERLVYVGDRADVDGLGAKRAGMRFVHVGLPDRGVSLRSDSSMSWPSLVKQMREAGVRAGKSCWICGSTDTHSFRACSIRGNVGPEDYRITDSAYGQTAPLIRCRQCGFVFASELPTSDPVSAYRLMTDPDYQAGAAARRVQMRRILQEALRALPRARTLLDVGAGTGLLIQEAVALGLQSHGVEPSHWCVDQAQQINRVPLLCGTLEECVDQLGHYDLVMLVDVVEHVPDPLALIRQAASQLSAGGRMIIVTPDVESVAARLLGRRWWHYRVAHIGYFSLRSMRAALYRCGLEEVSHQRSGWRFQVSYLMRRLGRYSPVRFLSRTLARLADLPWVSRRELDLNLLDSYVFVVKKIGAL